MLKADLHIHTCFSFDTNITPEEIVAQCLKVGINCIAITDHGNIDGALKVKEIAPFKVIVGQEVYTREGELMGLFLKSSIPHGLSAEKTAQAIISQGGIVGIPHPLDRFKRNGGGEKLIRKLLPWLSFIEVFNARSLFWGDASGLARKYNLPGTVGSDAHTLGEIGRAYIELPPFNNAEDFLLALRQGVINGRRSSPAVHFLSAAYRIKKLLERRRYV